MGVDPLAMQYLGWSTYNYTMGNPVAFTDPTGTSVEGDYFDGKKYLGNDGVNDGRVYTINEVDWNNVNADSKGSYGTDAFASELRKRGAVEAFGTAKEAYLDQIGKGTMSDAPVATVIPKAKPKPEQVKPENVRPYVSPEVLARQGSIAPTDG